MLGNARVSSTTLNRTAGLWLLRDSVIWVATGGFRSVYISTSSDKEPCGAVQTSWLSWVHTVADKQSVWQFTQVQWHVPSTWPCHSFHPFDIVIDLFELYWYLHQGRYAAVDVWQAGCLQNNTKVSKLILMKFSGNYDSRPKKSWLVTFQIPADLLSGGLCSPGAFETCIISDINWSFHTFVEVVKHTPPLSGTVVQARWPTTSIDSACSTPCHFQESEVFWPFTSLSTHVLHHWEPVCHGNVDKLHFTAFSRRQFQLKRDLKWKSTF